MNRNLHSGEIAENIFSAIDVIVDKKLHEAQYDITILAKIVKVVDSELGRYEVQYQNARLTTFTIGCGVYREGDQVYVLIPCGDFSRDKYILGLGGRDRRANAIGDPAAMSKIDELTKRIEELEALVKTLSAQSN